MGVEFTRDGQPDTATCKAAVKACREEGLLLLTCGTYDNMVRWIPPLAVTPEQMEEGLRVFAAALDRL